MTIRSRRRNDADSGASLILAIAFVLVVGMISAGLVGLATSSLNNRTTLQRLRNTQYAADAAIELAIAEVRTRTCTPDTGFIVDSSVNAVAIRVDWDNACGVVQGGNRSATAAASSSDGIVVAQRNVVFSACISPGETCNAADVIIRAVVNFQQVLGGAVTKTYVQSWSVNR